MQSASLALILAALLHPGFTPTVVQSGPFPSNGLSVHAYGDISYENQTTYLDVFAIKLNEHPEAYGHVVVRTARGQLPGLAYRKLLTIKNYLVWYKQIAPERLSFQDAGRADCFGVELRLVASPPRAPAIDQDSSIIDGQIKDTLLYDTHVIADDEEESIPHEITLDLALLDELGRHVRTHRQFRAVLIGYARVGARTTGGTHWVNRLVRERKHYLVQKHHIAATRVSVLFGGYRSAPEIELFIGPPTGAYPRATPTRRPAGRQG